MEFRQLLNIIEDEPVFEPGLVLAGNVNPLDVRKQLSRWTAAGKIYQLRRGLYSLAPPYRKVIPHPFLVANRLQPGSYVSLQSALAFYGLIPEQVPVTTSVSTGRPASFVTPVGQFDFRHVKTSWLRGYQQIDFGNDQKAFVASPEKALLDLVYLQSGGDSEAYLRELRLQSFDRLNQDKIGRMAYEVQKPKLIRAVEIIQHLAEEEIKEYESL
jgi:predicted transcriptional regulator of viral defense system